MPSIYTTLKKSDRKFIRTEKARIRRQFSDAVKQEEMITEMYKKLVPAMGTASPAKPIAAEPKKEAKKVVAKKPKAKKAKAVA